MPKISPMPLTSKRLMEINVVNCESPSEKNAENNQAPNSPVSQPDHQILPQVPRNKPMHLMPWGEEALGF